MKRTIKNKRFTRYQFVTTAGKTVKVSEVTEEQAKAELCNLMDLIERIKSKQIDILDEIEAYGY